MKWIKMTILIIAISLSVNFTACASKARAYSDVQPDAWYASYIEICVNSGLMQGIGDDRFDPDGEVTVAQALTVCARLHHLLTGGDGDISAFYERRPDSICFFSNSASDIVAGYTDVIDKKTVTDKASAHVYFFFSDNKLLELRGEKELTTELILNIPHKSLEYNVTYVDSGDYSGSFCYTVDDNNIDEYMSLEAEIGLMSLYDRDFAEGKWYAPAVFYNALYHDPLAENLGAPYKELASMLSEYAEDVNYKDRMNAACNRANLAMYLALYIPLENLQPIKNVTEVPDLNAELVQRLYSAGILGGVNNSGHFDGHGTLTRAQLAAVVARVLEPDLRLK